MYNPAIATRLNASATAEATGLRLVITTSAEATTSSASTKKAICSIAPSVPDHVVGHEQISDREVGERERKESLPPEVHELVVAEAWNGPAHPHVQELEEGELADEGADLQAPQEPARLRLPRLRNPELPTAEKQRDRERRARHHVDVLGHEEGREAHPRILGVVSGDELPFRLGEVEGGAVGLGVPGDREEDEAQERDAAGEDVPVPERAGLLGDDLGRPQRS